MSKKNPLVDAYFSEAKQWPNELKQLRKIVLDTPLTEEMKWRVPCYTLENSNIAMIGGFKAYCVLSFFKGVLLKDPHGILVKPGENTQAARLIRFTGIQEIVQLTPILKDYLQEAIEVAQAGLKVDTSKQPKTELPEELRLAFKKLPALKKAFTALTPGRQRAYLLFFAGAKQSKTRSTRIEKYTPQILDGKGMDDCTCGLSQKMPACDGSHKAIR